jgi:hypothetical protein
MKVITWVMVALVIAGAAFMVVRPAQGCSRAHGATHTQPAAKPVTPAVHRSSFVIAARMGWF